MQRPPFCDMFWSDQTTMMWINAIDIDSYDIVHCENMLKLLRKGLMSYYSEVLKYIIHVAETILCNVRLFSVRPIFSDDRVVSQNRFYCIFPYIFIDCRYRMSDIDLVVFVKFTLVSIDI
jgi:hypothetical protein